MFIVTCMFTKFHSSSYHTLSSVFLSAANVIQQKYENCGAA